MAIDKKITYEDQRLTKAQQKKAKPVKSAGIKNYLGKQETVTVPKKWLSSPDHVVAELAYITPREQKILLDANLYGSLNGKPNRGPGGIMSLQGDMGSVGGGSSSNDGGDGNTGRERGANRNRSQTTSKSTTNNKGSNDGPKGPSELGVTTRAVNPVAISPVDRSAVSQFSTFGRNTMNQNLQGPNTFSNITGGIKDYILGGGLIGAGIRGLTNLGRLNNKDFYDQKVAPAGKTNLGFDDYMSARMAGTIDAYGNPTNNEQGGNDNQSVLNSGIAGIQGINTIGEETTDPTNTADTSNVDDMYFNFGTYSNPIYREDLV